MRLRVRSLLTIATVPTARRLPIDIAVNEPRRLPEGDLAALNNSFGFGGSNVAVTVTNANITD